jgi:hypothetical protein
MSGFQKTTLKCVLLGDNAILSTSPLLEHSKYFKFLFARAKFTAHHTSYNRPVKKWAIWGTFGPKFPGFLLVYGHLRAAGVAIGPLWPLFASRTHQDP